MTMLDGDPKTIPGSAGLIPISPQAGGVELEEQVELLAQQIEGVVNQPGKGIDAELVGP